MDCVHISFSPTGQCLLKGEESAHEDNHRHWISKLFPFTIFVGFARPWLCLVGCPFALSLLLHELLVFRFCKLHKIIWAEFKPGVFLPSDGDARPVYSSWDIDLCVNFPYNCTFWTKVLSNAMNSFSFSPTNPNFPVMVAGLLALSFLTLWSLLT